MNSLKIGVIASTLMFAGAPAQGQDRPSRALLFKPSPHYGVLVERHLQSFAPGDTPLTRARKALVLSMLVPGLGQVYNKSYLKAGAFIALEVISAYTYFQQSSRGDELDTKFKAYADAHWDPNRYWAALAAEFGCDITDFDCLKTFERESFSHHLPDAKNQTYYENIGKYDQFNIGWDDATAHKQRDSAHRERYTFMRKDSNDAYARARLGATIWILNHIVSGLEAGFSAHQKAKRTGHSLGFAPMRIGDHTVAVLEMSVRW